MAEKTQQVYPLAPANGAPRSDDGESAAAVTEKEAKRKKRMKLIVYIGAFAVFQVIVILVFVMVVMRVHRPKFRVAEPLVGSLNTDPSSPSFNMSFTAPFRVKNANFGPYKYDQTTVFFMYAGAVVGQVDVPKSKANFKSTKKVDLPVTVSSSNLASVAAGQLRTELGSGTLTLRSQAQMTGKVELMLIFKKKKATFMDCTMVINTSTQAVQSLACK